MRTHTWLAALALGFATLGAAAQPPLEDFFRIPQVGGLTLSPDGKSLAALAPVNGRRNLVIIDLESRTPKPVTSFTTRDIVEIRWVNNKRLLLRTGSIAVEQFQARGGGLYAINSDGTEGRLLAEGADERMNAGFRFVYRPVAVVRMLPGETDEVIAQEYIIDNERSRAGDLFRLDTRTGQRISLSEGKPDAGENEGWVVDRDGVPRVLGVSSQGRVRIWYRAGRNAPWEKHDERPSTSPGWGPLAVDEDGKSLVVADGRTRDKMALVRYDPATRAFGDVLAQHPQVDLTDLVTSREGQVLGIRFQADRGGAAWFDEGLARVQRAIDSAFPDKVNRISWSDDRSRFLVFSYSDVSPTSFYLLEAKSSKLQPLGEAMPWIKPEEMSPMQPVRYQARDGLEIPAYLTIPRKGPQKNLPLVVVVHGGPWVPGYAWGFDREAQFLASRGYAALQPNFRGTTRYGWKHFASSFGQWGLAMQDDVADGVKWAVDQGIVDPKRVCIYGGSYGGYATMMGLARHPELYRCGINYVGVTDMELFLTATWADYAYSDAVLFSIKEMVGDWSREAERLKAVSPVQLASRIKAPVLMAYGLVDFRVPIEHGTRMRAALERHGAKPVWLVAEGEGHGFRDPKNQALFYGTMEKFLREHLGGGS